MFTIGQAGRLGKTELTTERRPPARLRQGAGSVTEVAYSVGFDSLSYFRRAFRERFAASPTEHLLAPPPAPHA